MANDERLQMEGVVTDIIKGGKFLVKLNDNDFEVTCTLSGKMRVNSIRIIKGDAVTIDLSPYDLKNGRIIYRNKV